MTQLALCLNSTGGCKFMRIYTVWRKTRWERGKRVNDSIVCVFDSTSKRLHRIHINDFRKNFRILSKREITPSLWKDIRDKRRTTIVDQMDKCASKKAP